MSSQSSDKVNHTLLHIGAWTSDSSNSAEPPNSPATAQQSEHITLTPHPDVATVSEQDIASILAEYRPLVKGTGARITASLRLLSQASQMQQSIASSVCVELGASEATV
jgi:hypothetical protein